MMSKSNAMIYISQTQDKGCQRFGSVIQVTKDEELKQMDMMGGGP